MARTDTLGNFLTDVAEAIRTKEGTTGTIPASEFDTRISNLSGGGEPDLDTDPDYIKDGLIAWFDGSTDMINWDLPDKIDPDYTYIRTSPTGISGSYGDYAYPKKPYGSKALVNNMTYTCKTNKDYYVTGYTIEIVGLLDTYNSSGSGGGWLIAGNTSGAWGIGVAENNGRVIFLNTAEYQSRDKTYTGYYNKRFGATLHLKNVFTRSSPTGYVELEASVDGEPYHNIKQTNSFTRSTAENCLAVLCYYTSGTPYRANGELYCLRIYNRRLTNEEIAHNHEIDKKRFKLHDYVE